MYHFADMPDENLMDFIRGGNVRAFDALVNRHHARFHHMVYRWVLHQHDAEDIVQDAFLKLWSGKARWKAHKKTRFTTWFYRILYNQAMDKLRTRKRRFEELGDHIASNDASPEQLEAERQYQQNIRRVLWELPDKQRIAIQLYYFEQLRQKDIADMMGITLKSLESHLSRAKHDLRERIAYDD